MQNTSEKKFNVWNSAQRDQMLNMSLQKSSVSSWLKDPNVSIFVPKQGQNTIKILPPLQEEGVKFDSPWGLSVWQYWLNPLKLYLLSPSTFNSKVADPLNAYCLFERNRIEELRKVHGIDSEQPNLRAMRRTLIWVIDLMEDNKVKLWACSKSILDDLLVICRQGTGDYLPIEDLDNGFPLSFSRDGEGKQTKYKGLQVGREPYAVNPEIINSIKYFRDILNVFSSDDAEAYLKQCTDLWGTSAKEEPSLVKESQTTHTVTDEDLPNTYSQQNPSANNPSPADKQASPVDAQQNSSANQDYADIPDNAYADIVGGVEKKDSEKKDADAEFTKELDSVTNNLLGPDKQGS